MKKCALACLVLALLVAGPVLWYVARPYYRDARCRRHLEEMCRASIMYAGDFDEVYPDSLRRLADYGIDPAVLTCPAANMPPGALSDIDRWSGYTLVTGISTKSHPSSVFVYCPPENHGGRCGHVAFIDGHVETLTKDEFETLLAERGIVEEEAE